MSGPLQSSRRRSSGVRRKRAASSEESDFSMDSDPSDAFSSDIEPFNDGYDSDLYGDEEDRAYLMSLSQLEREEILYDRGEQRDILREKYERENAAKIQQKAQRGYQLGILILHLSQSLRNFVCVCLFFCLCVCVCVCVCRGEGTCV